MTVDEMIEWLESAKRQSEQSGQDISNYPIYIEYVGSIHLKVDHGENAVFIIEE